MKIRLGPTQNLYPMPCPIVVGGTMDQPRALTVAWINVVSSTPPTVAMGVRRTRHTLEAIRERGTFTVNVPPASLAAETDYFGIASGRTADKFAVTGLSLVPSAVIETPIIEQCPFNLECRVTGETEVGEYVVVLGEVLESHADESVLDGGGAVDIEALDPLVYIAGARQYRRLGDKVADAFKIGRSFGDSA
ncbi:MAG: flavin reductase family protein [Coriobacteriales bacterium]|nr:flavin reductase family protein [Coriobacteriales bacterium]